MPCGVAKELGGIGEKWGQSRRTLESRVQGSWGGPPWPVWGHTLVWLRKETRLPWFGGCAADAPWPSYPLAPELCKAHVSHWEDGQASVGCPGPEKHSKGGESRSSGCWEAYEGAGRAEATRQMTKLAALNKGWGLAQHPWFTSESESANREHSLRLYSGKGQGGILAEDCCFIIRSKKSHHCQWSLNRSRTFTLIKSHAMHIWANFSITESYNKRWPQGKDKLPGGCVHPILVAVRSSGC